MASEATKPDEVEVRYTGDRPHQVIDNGKSRWLRKGDTITVSAAEVATWEEGEHPRFEVAAPLHAAAPGQQTTPPAPGPGPASNGGVPVPARQPGGAAAPVANAPEEGKI
jgi:hypothetical protein